MATPTEATGAEGGAEADAVAVAGAEAGAEAAGAAVEAVAGAERNGEDVVMDAAGRILVPSALRGYAELDKAAVLVGQGHKFELWNKDNWDERMEKGGDFGSGGLPPELEGFSL